MKPRKPRLTIQCKKKTRRTLNGRDYLFLYSCNSALIFFFSIHYCMSCLHGRRCHCSLDLNRKQKSMMPEKRFCFQEDEFTALGSNTNFRDIVCYKTLSGCYSMLDRTIRAVAYRELSLGGNWRGNLQRIQNFRENPQISDFNS